MLDIFPGISVTSPVAFLNEINAKCRKSKSNVVGNTNQHFDGVGPTAYAQFAVHTSTLDRPSCELAAAGAMALRRDFHGYKSQLDDRILSESKIRVVSASAATALFGSTAASSALPPDAWRRPVASNTAAFVSKRMPTLQDYSSDLHEYNTMQEKLACVFSRTRELEVAEREISLQRAHTAHRRKRIHDTWQRAVHEPTMHAVKAQMDTSLRPGAPALQRLSSPSASISASHHAVFLHSVSRGDSLDDDLLRSVMGQPAIQPKLRETYDPSVWRVHCEDHRTGNSVKLHPTKLDSSVAFHDFASPSRPDPTTRRDASIDSEFPKGKRTRSHPMLSPIS